MSIVSGGSAVGSSYFMSIGTSTADPPLTIDIKAGRQNVKGYDAIGFLRFRKGYKDADLGRVKAQQQFMSAILSKMKEPKTLARSPLLLTSYVSYTENNIPVKKLIKMAAKMRHVTSEDIVTNTLPGTPKYMGGVSYFVPNENKIQVMLLENNFK